MKKVILIVEDDAILQKTMKVALESKDYSVLQAFDGNEGLTIAKKERPDLILLDLVMPEKSGFHVLEEIKKNEEIKHIPVIVLSAISTESSIAECKFLKADDYLTKTNYSLESIVEKIDKMVKTSNS